MKKGFDSKIYFKEEERAILERIKKFDKLYLEIGGKLLLDKHASRVLPGYDPKTKIHLLKKLPDKEIIYCINANDIQNKRIIHDFNLNVNEHAIKNILSLKKFNFKISAVVITLYENQKIDYFKKRIEKLGIKVFIQKKISNYPNNLNSVLRGFESQPYVKTKSKLIIVTGVASNSGKMGMALNQIYHENKIGIKTGFAKLETFPVFNLPINNPINLAYEAATADLNDKNMIDPYYKKAYNRNTVNYNRDIENFAILKKISEAITKKQFIYKSPTEMGINKIKDAIINQKICEKAAITEIKNRYNQFKIDYNNRKEKYSTLKRMKQIIKKLNN